MKNWIKGGIVGVILFILYYIIGSLLSSGKPSIQEFIPIFLFIVLYCTLIGLFIDSIKLNWQYWIKGGILSVVICSFPLVPINLLIATPIGISLFGCHTDGLMLLCSKINTLVVYFIAALISFIIGALIGWIIGKYKK